MRELTWSQFRQHFMHCFFVWKFHAQFFVFTFSACTFFHKIIGTKAAQKMLMELTHRVIFAKILRSAFLPIFLRKNAHTTYNSQYL